MDSEVFNLTIVVESHVGSGYVQLRIDKNVFVLASTQSFDVTSGSEVEIKPVSSYGNVFPGWPPNMGWLKEAIYENEQIRTGRISETTEVVVQFVDETSSIQNELDEESEEIKEEIIQEIPPRYGILRVSSTEGGYYMLRTDEFSLMKESPEFVEYSVKLGSPVELLGVPSEGYSFTRISGDVYWLNNGYGDMIDGEYHANVEFEEIVEEEIEEEPEEELESAVEEVSVTEDAESYQYLSFGGMMLPSVAERSFTAAAGKSITIDLVYDHEGTPKAGTYRMNGEKFHDLVLIRGNTYTFTANHQTTVIEIVDENYQLLANGLWDEDLVFTPDETTPDELIYRSSHRNDVGGKIHVRDGTYYGRVTAYGYVDGCTVQYDATDVASGTLGEYLIPIGDTPESINPSVTATGTDIYTGVTNSLTYKTVRGSIQINALTTLFAHKYEGGFAPRDSVTSINDRMRYSLGLTFPCDILNDDPIHEILTSATDERKWDYAELLKRSIILNSLLNFVNEVDSSKLEELYSHLARQWGANVFQFAESSYMEGLLRRIVEKTAIPEIAQTLANLFGYVLNLNMKSAASNWQKLFVFGRAFEDNFLTALKNTNDGSAGEATSAWGDLATHLNTAELFFIKSEAYSGANLVKIPEFVVMKTGVECDADMGSSLQPIMKKGIDANFVGKITNNAYQTLTTNTLRHIYDKVISVEYTLGNTHHACYSVSTLPVEFVPEIPLLLGDITSFGNESIDECCSNLPETQIWEPPTDIATSIFSFKLIESGESTVMYNTEVTTKSHPIEYLGNDEYRLYLDGDVVGGSIPEASPGYCIVPAGYATEMEQRYLKVGYNSGNSVRDVGEVVADDTQFKIRTSMTILGFLECTVFHTTDIGFTTPIAHPFVKGEFVKLVGSQDAKVDGIHEITDLHYLSSVFVVYISGIEDKSPWIGLEANIDRPAVTRIYCETDNLEVGDTVAFDKTTNGLTFNIDKKGNDAKGFYLEFTRTLPSDVKTLAKSHVNEDLGEVVDIMQPSVVEFMYSGKTRYHTVAGTNISTERLWLVYTPDIAPKGRAGHKVSYIQFFYNKNKWAG